MYTANKKTPQVAVTPTNPPTKEIPHIETPPVGILTIETCPIEPCPIVTPETNTPRAHSATVNTSRPTGSNISSIINQPSDAMAPIPDNNASNDGSYTSTLPDVFDIDMDGPEPQSTGPWVAICHVFTVSRPFYD